MRIFVTGGTGFLGSHVIRLASQEGHTVVAPFREGAKGRIGTSKAVLWIKGDLERRYHQELAGCDVLIHLAAHGVLDPKPDWQRCLHTNVLLSAQLWEDAISAGVRRLVVAGSCFEYGKSGERYEFIPTDAPLYPTGPYHASKAAATMAAIGLCYQRSVELAVLRPFNLFGVGDESTRFWPQLITAARDGADFEMTSGEQIRDFTPVEHAASIFVNTATKEFIRPGDPVIKNVGTGKPISLRDFAATEWKRHAARGKLLVGHRPQRKLEVMRYVPKIP